MVRVCKVPKHEILRSTRTRYAFMHTRPNGRRKQLRNSSHTSPATPTQEPLQRPPAPPDFNIGPLRKAIHCERLSKLRNCFRWRAVFPKAAHPNIKIGGRGGNQVKDQGVNKNAKQKLRNCFRRLYRLGACLCRLLNDPKKLRSPVSTTRPGTLLERLTLEPRNNKHKILDGSRGPHTNIGRVEGPAYTYWRG
jgi:hypothetical protein